MALDASLFELSGLRFDTVGVLPRAAQAFLCALTLVEDDQAPVLVVLQ